MVLPTAHTTSSARKSGTSRASVHNHRLKLTRGPDLTFFFVDKKSRLFQTPRNGFKHLKRESFRLIQLASSSDLTFQNFCHGCFTEINQPLKGHDSELFQHSHHHSNTPKHFQLHLPISNLLIFPLFFFHIERPSEILVKQPQKFNQQSCQDVHMEGHELREISIEPRFLCQASMERRCFPREAQNGGAKCTNPADKQNKTGAEGSHAWQRKMRGFERLRFFFGSLLNSTEILQLTVSKFAIGIVICIVS